MGRVQSPTQNSLFSESQMKPQPAQSSGAASTAFTAETPRNLSTEKYLLSLRCHQRLQDTWAAPRTLEEDTVPRQNSKAAGKKETDAP